MRGRQLLNARTLINGQQFQLRVLRDAALLLALAIALSSGSVSAAQYLAPESSTTTWTVADDHKTILLSINHATPSPFVIKGVDYSPRPIDDAALTLPGTDYFWGDPAHLTYGLIWMRDLWGSTYNDSRINLPDGFVRQLGANSIRTYAWWKWVPMTPADYSKWRKLDWSVGPRVRFGASQAPAGFAHFPAHDGGDQFLDLCWNHGVNPIYVVIGISVDPWTGFSSTNEDSTSRREEQKYIELTARWLAQRYGYHPALLGFAIGNETNLPFELGTDRYLEYWQYLNHLSAIAKRYAPGKLTMTAFADYPWHETPMLLRPLVTFARAADAHPGGRTVPVCVDRDGGNPGMDCSSAGRRRAYPADVYALDVWGFNAYRRPESEDIANFKHLVVDGNYTKGAAIASSLVNPKPKPLILTEWGAPVSIRTHAAEPPPPPNSSWVTTSPGVPGEFHGAPGYRTAKMIQQLATDMYGPRARLSTLDGGILSGGYIFELQDEWWKESQRRPETWASHDTTILTNKFSFGEPGSGFSSYWDEEWFGLMSAAPSPGRIASCASDKGAFALCSGKKAGIDEGRCDDPVLTGAGDAGWLNGGADVLTPRAGFYALQAVFGGSSPHNVASGRPQILASRIECSAGSFCQVPASNDATSFAARGLPPGMQIDPHDGIIFGTASSAGDYPVLISAANDRGRSEKRVTLEIPRGAAIAIPSNTQSSLTSISFPPKSIHH
jgi:hypothetical protein